MGRKNRPVWRIVVLDSRSKRDGAFLGNLGTYDPLTHQIVTIELDQIQQWIAKGAQCSPTVTKLLKQYKRTQATS